MKNHLVCLVGLKGSGKSTIGSRLQSTFGWKFVRVEDVWINLSASWNGTREAYIREGFLLQKNLILELLRQHPIVVFESTGTTDYFSQMLGEFVRVAKVSLVKVECDSTICVERVMTRDSSTHVNVSDSQLKEINEAASKVELNWDCVVQNDGSTSPDKVAQAIESLLRS